MSSDNDQEAGWQTMVHFSSKKQMKNKDSINSEGVYFPPEWGPQDAIMLTWPHEGTDWSEILPEVEKTYTEIAREVVRREKLLVVCRDTGKIKSLFTKEEISAMLFYEIPANDTWARDHGPIATYINGIPVINDFQFNGWGNKFDARLDNLINQRLIEQKAFLPGVLYKEYPGFVLEGGSIESDGNGTIITTSKCLLNPNRNPHLSQMEIEAKLMGFSGAKKILWLDYGFLEGDDTDSHIDTLARFCNENTICYVRCEDRNDLHFEELRKMEEQLKQFTNSEGTPYKLVALPLPEPVYNQNGARMSATYANFLIMNGAVLVPVYGQSTDHKALETLAVVFPELKITGINCLPLIEQNGSLHCITMQIPEGFLK